MQLGERSHLKVKFRVILMVQLKKWCPVPNVRYYIASSTFDFF